MNKKGLISITATLAMQASAVGAEELIFDFLNSPLVPVEKIENSKIIRNFELSAKLNGIEIKIRDCKTAFYTLGGKNISHVASCMLHPTRFPVMICDDQISGNFALAMTFTKSPEEMATFLKNHCYGG